MYSTIWTSLLFEHMFLATLVISYHRLASLLSSYNISYYIRLFLIIIIITVIVITIIIDDNIFSSRIASTRPMYLIFCCVLYMIVSPDLCVYYLIASYIIVVYSLIRSLPLAYIIFGCVLTAPSSPQLISSDIPISSHI